MQIPNIPTPDEVENGPPSLFLNNEPITVKPARASRGGDLVLLTGAPKDLNVSKDPRSVSDGFI